MQVNCDLATDGRFTKAQLAWQIVHTQSAVRLGHMVSHPNRRNLLLVLLALSVLVVRMGNAHLHLCLDGAEPPSSIHILDADFHIEGPSNLEAMSAPHHDLDISLVTHALSKSSKLNVDDMALLATVLALFGLLAFGKLAFTSAYVRPPFSTPHYLRPPLRGPPA